MNDPDADEHGGDARFDDLFAQVSAGGFGHREHVHLTWLVIRAHGAADAAGIIANGLRDVSRAAGVPEKYHATMTEAWVRLVAHHIAEDRTIGFDAFVDRNPALLDKGLIGRFYRPSTLMSDVARADWVEPDLAPLPG